MDTVNDTVPRGNPRTLVANGLFTLESFSIENSTSIPIARSL